MKDDFNLNSCDYSFSPEELISRAESIISDCRIAYNAFAGADDNEVGFETIVALNNIARKVNNGHDFLAFAQHVSPRPDLRNASTKADIMFQDFAIETGLRKDLFHKICTLHDLKLDLSHEPKRYIEKMIEDGKRNGLHLEESVQGEIKCLQQRINNLAVTFKQNLANVNFVAELTDEDLDGMDDKFLNSLSKSPDSGLKKVTLAYPHYFPIMKTCRNAETRKRINIAFDSQCMNENVPILEELVSLRHKLANLLGYGNHATYRIEVCHAKKVETVQNFLMELFEKLQPLWQEEKQVLLEEKEKECSEMKIPFDGNLNAWDVSYYITKSTEKTYNIDYSMVQEYFPLPAVTKGLLMIYEKLLGLKFKEVKKPKVWHPDVAMFSVEDADDSRLLGYFYFDLFPREGKYKHACIKYLQSPCMKEDGTRQICVVSVIANFSASAPGRPSLLESHEVKTFFHEFGHVMHVMCSQTKYSYFNLNSLERDFIEAPSQMLENWCWEEVPLKLMSSHYVTGNPLPDDVIRTLTKTRFAYVGFKLIRQIVLSLFDMEIHTSEMADTKASYDRMSVNMLGITPPEGTNFSAHFGHMAELYDAQYYGYLWSNVFSMDMFAARFKGRDLMDPVIGREYRQRILEPFASKDAAEMLRDFLGREPNQDAFLHALGVKVH